MVSQQSSPLLSGSLYIIFYVKTRLDISTFPDDWKVAKVFPLFQSGERNDPNNFRPINSVLPAIATVFERLVYEQMYAYFTENNLIQPRQSGFRSLHSTVTALLDMTNRWCLNIDKGMVSGVIFLDLKKAFDTVDHAILLKKLSDVGVQGQTAYWFKPYLKDRQQFCVVSGLSSVENRIVCGVPHPHQIKCILKLFVK